MRTLLKTRLDHTFRLLRRRCIGPHRRTLNLEPHPAGRLRPARSRTVASENEVPNMIVRRSGAKWMSSAAARQCDRGG
jgi:hypothetical protein